MAEDPGSRVNLERARAEYEKFREATRTRPEKGRVTIRAVARIVEDVNLEGTVRGHRLEADKLGLEGPGAAFDEVAFALTLKSPAPAEQVRRLIAHAERGCHAEQTFR